MMNYVVVVERVVFMLMSECRFCAVEVLYQLLPLCYQKFPPNLPVCNDFFLE